MESSWDPRNYLEEISYEKARLSSPYLLAEIDRFFPKLSESWKPLFLTLGVKEPVTSYRLVLDQSEIKSDLGYVAGYEVNSLRGYLFVDSLSLDTIVLQIANTEIKKSAEIIISYLFRRLLVSLEKAWIGNTKLKVSYLEDSSIYDIETNAKLYLDLKFENATARIVFGVPLGLIEIFSKTVSEINRINVSDLNLELFSVFVKPEMLLDYIRNGSVITSPNPISDNVNLYANDQPWAQGKLKICQDRFAVEISSLMFPKQENSSGNTRISVQLDKIKVSQDLKSHKALGSVITTDIKLNTPLSIIVSGEKIGTASMTLDPNNCPTIKLISKY